MKKHSEVAFNVRVIKSIYYVDKRLAYMSVREREKKREKENEEE